MAVRLEGRVVRTEGGWDHRPIQSFYYVESYRRTLPEERPPGQRATLVQFWGKKFRREWDVEKNRYPKIFDEVETPDDLHTVDVPSIVAVMNLDDEEHPFDEDDL